MCSRLVSLPVVQHAMASYQMSWVALDVDLTCSVHCSRACASTMAWRHSLKVACRFKESCPSSILYMSCNLSALRSKFSWCACLSASPSFFQCRASFVSSCQAWSTHRCRNLSLLPSSSRSGRFIFVS